MKKRLWIGATFALILLFLIIYIKSDYKRTPPTLYLNANIITMDAAQPSAQAMFVKNGRIEAIGNAEDLDQSQLEGVQRVDLQGATVLPGFIDPHTHAALTLFMMDMIDLSGFKHRTNAEVWSYFREAVQEAEPGAWLVCKGIDPILVEDIVVPTLQFLDENAPENPVLLFSQSLHTYWANSKAFELAGIDKDTPKPSDHSYYEKDSLGNLTGVIIEQQALRPIMDLLTTELISPAALSAAAPKMMTDYARNGNTTIATTGLTIQDEKPLLLFQHLSAQSPTLLGSLAEKLGMLPKRQPAPRHFIYMRHDLAHLLPEKKAESDHFYDIIGIKHWYDGSPYTGSMYMDSAYLETALTTNKMHITPGSRGEALLEEQELGDFIRKYHEQGWQISIHTQGRCRHSGSLGCL